jgi:ABC-type polysaccharide/polyol phosphate transport system ATPase subunit
VSHAIEVSNVSKLYRRYGRRRHFGTLKSALLSGRLFRDLQPDEVLEALRDVSFTVDAGRTFGIIGRNGSGKSTMLKMIAGIGKPTTGQVRVNGRVSALIELGAGFHPEISGRENVFINGMMLGLSRRTIAERFDEIVAFAELESFIDAPVKTYSSGMYMRLGFAVAINVDPDVLLVDEVLAVGDQAFTNKCLDKFNELRRDGRTIVLVTHSLDMVTRFCEEALWLDHGEVRSQGAPAQVIDAYLAAVARTEQAHLPPARTIPPAIEVTSVQLLDRDRQPTTTFASGDSVAVQISMVARERISDATLAFGIFNADGVRCCGAQTDVALAWIGETARAVAVCEVERLDLVGGSYTLDAVVRDRGGTAVHENHRTTFTVASTARESGILRLPHRWSQGERSDPR